MAVTIYQVDAFTSDPFKGNPAAVCILDEPGDETWMQQVALEMNLSETAFLYREGDHFNLRWFTPVLEVDLCGHATLASAHVLWETGRLSPDAPARFLSRSGALSASNTDGLITLDFPATPPVAIAEVPHQLNQALGLSPLFVGRSRFDYLVEVDRADTLARLNPDHTLLKSLDLRGIMVTSRADENGYDFVSRFFAPATGIDEDPVTGSAHCCLGPYWESKLGKSVLMARQISPRGGELHVRVAADRVHIGGYAVTVMRGELLY